VKHFSNYIWQNDQQELSGFYVYIFIVYKLNYFVWLQFSNYSFANNRQWRHHVFCLSLCLSVHFLCVCQLSRVNAHFTWCNVFLLSGGISGKLTINIHLSVGISENVFKVRHQRSRPDQWIYNVGVWHTFWRCSTEAHLFCQMFIKSSAHTWLFRDVVCIQIKIQLKFCVRVVFRMELGCFAVCLFMFCKNCCWFCTQKSRHEVSVSKSRSRDGFKILFWNVLVS